MPIPEIRFKYSWVYDDHWRAFYSEEKEWPSCKKLEGNIVRIEREWQKKGELVLKEMSKISGLKWREKNIDCYVVGKCMPFSFPLTIMAYKDHPIDYTVDVLTHELVHQLFCQGDNEKQSYKAWEYFYKRYKAEEFNTIIHIPVHAIHYHIFMKFFGEKRLKREMDSMNRFPDYKRAWDIVLEEGAENIIAEFKKRVA